MSIGKFFIFAILLPIATIYLTLTLKAERDEYVEHETADVVIEKKEVIIEKSEVSLNDKNNISNDPENNNAQESTELLISIEEIIRTKKSHKKITVSNNYKNIASDNDTKKTAEKSKTTQFPANKENINQ